MTLLAPAQIEVLHVVLDPTRPFDTLPLLTAGQESVTLDPGPLASPLGIEELTNVWSGLYEPEDFLAFLERWPMDADSYEDESVDLHAWHLAALNPMVTMEWLIDRIDQESGPVSSHLAWVMMSRNVNRFQFWQELAADEGTDLEKVIDTYSPRVVMKIMRDFQARWVGRVDEWLTILLDVARRHDLRENTVQDLEFYLDVSGGKVVKPGVSKEYVQKNVNPSAKWAIHFAINLSDPSKEEREANADLMVKMLFSAVREVMMFDTDTLIEAYFAKIRFVNDWFEALGIEVPSHPLEGVL